jgi:predicted permease
VSWRRIRHVVQPSPRAEARAEIAFHLEERRRELIASGVDPADARARAAAEFGPIEPVERAIADSTHRRHDRRQRTERFMNLTQDLHFGLRALRRNPVFAAAAIATLALGIGATLAVFNVVNGVLLRPLPYRHPERISMIWLSLRNDDGTQADLPLTSGFFSDIERDARTFESMAAFRAWPYALADGPSAEPERVAGARVTPALFRVLGAEPLLGRTFTPDEGRPGGPSVALISHDLWMRRFGGDKGVVGRTVYLSGAPFTVAGVMRQGFSFPRGAELPAPFGFGVRTDIWTPLVFDSTDRINYGTNNLSAVGRLPSACGEPARCASVAQAELTGMLRTFLAANAPRLKLDYRLVSMADQASAAVRRPLLILLGAVAFLLLIAAANVAGLMVARAHARQRELAVRTALGAGRWRVTRQLITENLVLCALGTVAGLAIAYWGPTFMLRLVPGSLPRADDVALDWRVWGVASALALLFAVLFGVAASYTAAWRGTELAGTLHTGDARSAGGVGHRNMRRLLVAGEVGLSLVLLIGAALLVRSFVQLQRVRPGFDARGALVANVSIPVTRFQPAVDGPGWAATFQQVMARLAAAPGVAAAGATSGLPMTGMFEAGGVRPVGRTYDPGQAPSAQYSVVAGDYFTAAGIRLVTGRLFDASDAADGGNRSTIIVNRRFAREQYGSETAAIGQEVSPTFELNPGRPPRTIVGVVDDVRNVSLDAEPRPQVYLPVAQYPYPRMAVVVRVKGGPGADPRGAAPLIRDAVREANRSATVHDIRTMEDVVSESLARQRFSMTLIGIFAGVALVLAMVGLYGVLALIASQRRREIGVRLALGASPGDVVRMMLREGATVAAVGVAGGLLGALAVTRVLQSVLYGVSSTDTPTFAAATLFVVAVALAATWLPARRVARVDPRSALAAE